MKAGSNEDDYNDQNGRHKENDTITIMGREARRDQGTREVIDTCA